MGRKQPPTTTLANGTVLRLKPKGACRKHSQKLQDWGASSCTLLQRVGEIKAKPETVENGGGSKDARPPKPHSCRKGGKARGAGRAEDVGIRREEKRGFCKLLGAP